MMLFSKALYLIVKTDANLATCMEFIDLVRPYDVS